MKKYKTELLRINNIAGIYYSIPGKKSSNILVYALGAPLLPDDGHIPTASIILDFDCDIFVPDYIGQGRSDGDFTPKNCIKTFTDLYTYFTEGCTAVNNYLSVKKDLKYDDVLFVGRSFGGAYVPLLPRFNSNIKNICLIYPVTDYTLVGTNPNEESITQFLTAFLKDGYKYIYRGITKPIWQKHFKNEDGLSPIDNIKYLKDANVFIGHGEKDLNINPSQSEIYFKKLIEYFPQNKNQYKLNIYKNADHSYLAANPGIKDFLKWLKIKKRSK